MIENQKKRENIKIEVIFT